MKIDSHSFANSAAVNAVFVDFVAFLFVQITSIQRGLLTCFSSTLVSSCFAEGADFFVFPVFTPSANTKLDSCSKSPTRVRTTDTNAWRGGKRG